MNLSLAKVFTIAQEKTIEFRWENYNALNHPNLAAPPGNGATDYVDEANAAVITSLLPGANMRQMQFGLHLRF
jgi:hypothetical protein